MRKTSLTIIALATCAVLLATAPAWLPFLVYVPLIGVSWVMGGHCAESPILLRLKGERCPQNNESAVTRENANVPIGSPPDCPLAQAVGFNNAAMFMDLISKGAKPNLCKGFPDTLFERATNCKYKPESAKQIFAELERLGVRHTDANRFLISQAKENCVPGIELAVSQGADPNTVSPEGFLPLHYTTRVADDESIGAASTLVRLGADPMRRTSQVDSPYGQARERLQNVGNWSRLESALNVSLNK